MPLPQRADLQLGGIIGMVDLVDVVAEHASRWFVGPVGSVLKNPKPLPFQLCKGQLGLLRSGGGSSADVLPDEMP